MNETEEPLTRVCRKCSAQSTTPGAFCPNCGSAYVRSGGAQFNKTYALAGLGASVAVLVVIGAFVIKSNHDSKVEKQEAASAIQEKKNLDARAAKRDAAIQEIADEAERDARQESITELEKNVVKHAKKVVKSGLMDGPIVEGSCTATGGGSSDDLTALTGTFDCMAINKINKDGTMTGYGYAGTIDWQSGEMTWQMDN